MAKAYADGYNKEYQQIAYDAFLCGYGAKCESFVSEGLEEAAEKASKTWRRNEDGSESKELFPQAFVRGFIAGAEWGAEHLVGVRKMIDPKKKKGRTDCSSQGEVPNDSLATQSYENIPNDLEEAAKEYARNYIPFDQCDLRDILRVFKAGAGWQKKRDDLETADLLAIAHLQGMEQQKAKMMEMAVEGRIGQDVFHNSIYIKEPEWRDTLDKFNDGDKVRVIVINED